MPEPPPALTAEGRSHWAPLCESLLQMGVLTGADTALVVLLANTLGEYDAAAADLARDGRYVPTASGALRPHPAQYIMRAARIDALAMMRQLGLSPASRPALRTGGREHATSESDFFSMG
jgi:P27 family predicted phage terminase small subunit